MAAQPVAHRLDADQYARIVESGAFADQRLELIDGIIVEMSPQSPRHAYLIDLLAQHLAGAEARLRVQLPFAASADSVPEPDLALVDEPPSPEHHPRTAILVIEVSVGSRAIDRGRKADLYAAAGVPVYWVVDLDARVVEVRTEPGPGGYESLRTLRPGDVLASPADGVAAIAVDELFRNL